MRDRTKIFWFLGAYIVISTESQPISPVRSSLKINFTAYQHRRALFVNDLDTAAKIMVSSDTAVAKQLSYGIKGSKDLNDRWNTE